MNKSLFFIALISITSLTYAQRVDLDRESFSYNYRNLPNLVIDKSFQTYSVNVDKTAALELFSNEKANNRINIEGRKKVTGKSHFQVNISMGDLIIESSKVESRYTVKKDDSGKEISRTYYYWAEVIYTFEASAWVNDINGNRLNTYTLAERRITNTYKTSEYSSSSAAADYYNNNKYEIKAKLAQEQIDAAASSLNHSLNYDFGYKTSVEQDKFWTLGSKKHEEYTAFNDAIQKAKAAIVTISANEIPADINDKFKSSIDYFNGILTKYTDPEEKGQKKLRYAAYYNLAYIYYALENFDKAIEFADLLVKNDYDVKDGERLIKDSNILRAEFVKHFINTRHFVPICENATAPE